MIVIIWCIHFILIMSNKFIQAFNINVSNGKDQKPPFIVPYDQPVYSTYTGNFIGYGPIPKGTMSDTPIWHKNHGKPFHVIDVNPTTNDHMMHWCPQNWP